MQIAQAQMAAAQAAYDNADEPDYFESENFDPTLEAALLAIGRDLDAAATACERGQAVKARRIALQVMQDLAHELGLAQ